MIGYDFFTRDNFAWRSLQQGVIPLSLPHLSPGLTKKKAREILKERNALFIRWNENFDGTTCRDWWHIIKDIPEELASYDRKTRSLIRKGLKLNLAKRCEVSCILSKGYSVYNASFASYGTHESHLTEEEFKARISSLPEGTEFWGVFERDSGQLIAFSQNLVMNNACFYDTMWLMPQTRKIASSFILFHEMNKYYLNERKLKYISAGSKNISHDTNIQEFLQTRFMFRKAYSELQVVYPSGIYLLVIIMYSGRNLFKNSTTPFFHKMNAFLEQEKICRACKKNK